MSRNAMPGRGQAQLWTDRRAKMLAAGWKYYSETRQWAHPEQFWIRLEIQAAWNRFCRDSGLPVRKLEA